jgi:hypothetical protein
MKRTRSNAMEWRVMATMLKLELASRPASPLLQYRESPMASL